MPERNLIVEGKKVEHIFFPGDTLTVSHGEFVFHNQTPQKKGCVVTACYFIKNNEKKSLPEFHIYSDDSLIEDVITVPPKSSKKIRITFPFQEVHVGIQFKYGLFMKCECDSVQYDAFSEFNVVQEINK